MKVTWFATGPTLSGKLEPTHHSYSSIMFSDRTHLLHYAVAESQVVNHEFLFSVRGVCAAFVTKTVKFNNQVQITNCQPWQSKVPTIEHLDKYTSSYDLPTFLHRRRRKCKSERECKVSCLKLCKTLGKTLVSENQCRLRCCMLQKMYVVGWALHSPSTLHLFEDKITNFPIINPKVYVQKLIDLV